MPSRKIKLFSFYGQQKFAARPTLPSHTPTQTNSGRISGQRDIEDMPAMYARLRDEAQVEIDAWLAQGGGLKTIVSITQSESMEKTVDANFHMSITIVFDEP